LAGHLDKLNDPEYLSSVRNLRESNAHFIEWIRLQVAALP